ncbi:LTA synthase family protein [Sphingomonas glacialis]|uniref:LTA synthase family protein n=2 Tax=Sphingomonas glacialis TaxID=658225 RepID=A0A502FQD7_9SPHN|nr:LTA synthase family protein [Sphingomonas glacialis]
MLIASMLLDATVRPRPVRFREPRGLALHVLAMTALFGFGLAVSGNAPVAALLAIALLALFVVASNAKFTMLGEPLVFSDLALLFAVARHPRFYFTAIPHQQRWFGAIAMMLAALTLMALFEPAPLARAVGLAVMVGAGAAMVALLRGRWFAAEALRPALEADLARFGLIATAALYWRRWRETADPQPQPPLPAPYAAAGIAAPQVIVIVQCESFADPVALTGDPSRALPGLAHARAAAWQYGELEVSGFGAYTMRTEYGVLFGRSEAALGFRRYDPFLSAHGEASYALSARLGSVGYRTTFVHPHDLRFYGRNRLMPAVGFDRLIGAEGFAPLPEGGGRYVDDRTLGYALAALVEEAPETALIYAVTMENHGPWDKHREPGAAIGIDAYLRHLRSSDAMLTALCERLTTDERPALLVFFGDHRPSIPGIVEPGGARHTPYVMLRFDGAGNTLAGKGRVDLTPADLHHAVLDCLWPPAMV